MASVRLPYINSFTDRHGKEYIYFRHRKRRVRLPEYSDPTFFAAYSKCLQSLAKIGTVPPKRSRRGYVYFLSGGHVVKIGFAKSVQSRFQSVCSTAPFPLELAAYARGTMEDEADLHRKFRRAHAHGEWFHAAPELMAYIEAVKKAQSLNVCDYKAVPR